MTIKILGSRGIRPQLQQISYKHLTFSAGEEQIRIEEDLSSFDDISVFAEVYNSQEVMKLAMILSAISSQWSSPYMRRFRLYLPYLPYSRQDRICYRGEAFGLEMFAKIIADAGNGKVSVRTYDAHSPVAATVFGKLNIPFDNIGVNEFIKDFREAGHLSYHDPVDNDFVIVAPDKGAVERANLAAAVLGVPDRNVLYGKKVRDPDDGKILGITILRDQGDGKETSNPELLPLPGNRVLIVDDICDGGRTFIELAKALRSYSVDTIDLYVTHGIFSRGFEAFDDGTGQSVINRFFVPNLFPGVQRPDPAFAQLITLPEVQ